MMIKSIIPERYATNRTWKVVYTKPRWEKKTTQLLVQKGIHAFCLLARSKRKWADRMKTAEIPLFDSYIFVYVNLKEELEALQATGSIHFIKYNGKAAEIGEEEINKIKNLVNQAEEIESFCVIPMKAGDKMAFSSGIFFELNAEVLEVQLKSVLVTIKQLNCTLIARLKVDLNDVSSSIMNKNYELKTKPLHRTKINYGTSSWTNSRTHNQEEWL